MFVSCFISPLLDLYRHKPADGRGGRHQAGEDTAVELCVFYRELRVVIVAGSAARCPAMLPCSSSSGQVPELQVFLAVGIALAGIGEGPASAAAV
jgi:hypothetical protein